MAGEEEENAGLSGWWVGQRVVDDDGFRATVRYIGPVATAKDPKATWIGVEWDDGSRGKHDGSVVKDDATIVRHFKCQSEGASASFLKPNKLDRGVSFTEVLHRRYVTMDAPLEAPNQVFEDAYANTSKGGKKQIEFHGEEKIRKRQQIDVLEKVSMRGERVAWAGTAVKEEAAHITEVDLQGNLLSRWEDVGELASQMPKLEVLHLNSNSMQPLEKSPPILKSAFLHLRTLVLNSCGIKSWLTIATLEPHLPVIEELALASNYLGDILSVIAPKGQTGSPPFLVPGFLHLKLLDLSATGLSSWNEVLAFSALPQLRCLSLKENAIESITTMPPSAFSKVESLSLSGNKISTWASIDSLSCLPCLSGLRFTNNLLTQDLGQSEVRQLIIARLKGLVRVNGAEVSKKERVEAEKSFLRRVTREVAKEEGTDGKASMLKQYPRYAELVALHGDPGASNTGADGTTNLAAEVLSVRLVSLATSCLTAEPVEKRLPGSMTVGRLKQLLQRLFKLDPDLQTLYYKSEKNAPPTMLDDDDQSLSYFGVCNGCEIFMNEIDVKQIAKEKEARRKEEERRIAEQMKQIEVLEDYRKAQISLETASFQKAAAGTSK